MKASNSEFEYSLSFRRFESPVAVTVFTVENFCGHFETDWPVSSHRMAQVSVLKASPLLPARSQPSAVQCHSLLGPRPLEEPPLT